MEEAMNLDALDEEERDQRSSLQHKSGGRTALERDEEAGSHAAVHLLRTTHRHHVSLSMMADQKASILIGASFVLLTILFAHIREHQITVSLMFLTVTTITAAFFAVLAVMPRVSTRTIPRNQINPLFFGTFASLDPDEYESMMLDILNNEEECLKAMVRDIYQMGCVLHRKKYRYLAYSYKVFGVGFIVTFLMIVGEYFNAWSQLPWVR